MARKTQIAWMRNLVIENCEESCVNPFELVARDVRAGAVDSRGGNYYGTDQKACEHYLRGLGLSGFPFYDDAQAAQLAAWGYKPTPKMIANFWTVSAGLLVDVLRAENVRIF